MCTSGKRSYDTPQAAYRAMQTITTRRRRDHQRRTEQSAYRCPACGAWHLTHYPRTSR